MPPLLTYAARISDGLPLVASFSRSSENLDQFKNEARQIFRNLNGSKSAAKMSIETSSSKIFHYVMKENVCYLTLTEQSYPKRLIFLYLEEVADSFVDHLSQEHGDSWRDMIQTAARPYAFIQFDPVLQRKQREFIDPKSRKNETKLNQDLSDIHSIMRQNIEQVLDRGEKLENVSQISNSLVSESKKFKWGAKKLTWQAMINQYAPIVAITTFVIFVLYIKFFW